jgi:membrane-associated phospholipid phosphatase
MTGHIVNETGQAAELQTDGLVRGGPGLVTGRTPTRLERVLLTPALPDWIVVGYLCTVVIGLVRAPGSPARDTYLGLVGAVLLLFLVGVYHFRLRLEPRAGGPTYGLLLAYHLLPIFAVLAVYFNLRSILPIINPVSYDAALHQLDVALFGLEPTLAIEPLSTPRVVEWFSFFYYSYFFLIASFIFVMVFTCSSDERLASFATGVLLVVGIGHYVYTLVPGVGPYAFLAHEYSGPLQGGPFYFLVLDTVGKAGAMRDIFPSLHTALPTYLSLFAWRYYPKVAMLATVFACNIIGATIVLRWHYAVDVVAGLLLAVVSFMAAPRLVEAYQARRHLAGLFLRRW